MKNLVVFVLICLPWAFANTSGQSIESFLVFDPDIRLFTGYAFMNAAGYDHDWMKEMHPIRSEVRAYLDSVLDGDYNKKIAGLYQDLGGGNFHGYGAAALHLGNPPMFNHKRDQWDYEYLEDFAGYDTILRKFYREARVDELWERYERSQEEISIRYMPFAELAQYFFLY